MALSCPTCSRCFGTERGLKQHQRLSHAQPPQIHESVNDPVEKNHRIRAEELRLEAELRAEEARLQAKLRAEETLLQAKLRAEEAAKEREMREKEAAKEREMREKEAAKEREMREKEAAKEREMREKEAAKEREIREKELDIQRMDVESKISLREKYGILSIEKAKTVATMREIQVDYMRGSHSAIAAPARPEPLLLGPAPRDHPTPFRMTSGHVGIRASDIDRLAESHGTTYREIMTAPIIEELEDIAEDEASTDDGCDAPKDDDELIPLGYVIAGMNAARKAEGLPPCAPLRGSADEALRGALETAAARGAEPLSETLRPLVPEEADAVSAETEAKFAAQAREIEKKDRELGLLRMYLDLMKRIHEKMEKDLRSVQEKEVDVSWLTRCTDVLLDIDEQAATTGRVLNPQMRAHLRDQEREVAATGAVNPKGRPFPKSVRDKVFLRAQDPETGDFQCESSGCGTRSPRAAMFEVGHIVPRKLGGGGTLENALLQCRACNVETGCRVAAA